VPDIRARQFDACALATELANRRGCGWPAHGRGWDAEARLLGHKHDVYNYFVRRSDAWTVRYITVTVDRKTERYTIPARPSDGRERLQSPPTTVRLTDRPSHPSAAVGHRIAVTTARCLPHRLSLRGALRRWHPARQRRSLADANYTAEILQSPTVVSERASDRTGDRCAKRRSANSMELTEVGDQVFAVENILKSRVRRVSADAVVLHVVGWLRACVLYGWRRNVRSLSFRLVQTNVGFRHRDGQFVGFSVLIGMYGPIG